MRNACVRAAGFGRFDCIPARCYTDVLLHSLAASVGADDSVPPRTVAKVDYRNLLTGDFCEVEMTSADAAPAQIVIHEDGTWRPLDPAAGGDQGWKRIDWVKVGSVHATIKHDGPSVPRGVVRDAGGVRHRGQKLPVSMSLPLDGRRGEVVTEHGQSVVRHSDGTLSTLEGERIIRNSDDARKHGESCGFVRRT